MIIKKSKEQKKYLDMLKNIVSSFTVNFKKRYIKFPWSQISKVTKIQLNSPSSISIDGKDFTVKELVKEINTNKTKMQSRLKNSYYNYILRAYMCDSVNKSGNDLKAVYNQYRDEMDEVFKETREVLLFCIEGLKEINKMIKEDKKVVTEAFENKTNINNINKEELKKASIAITNVSFNFIKSYLNRVDIRNKYQKDLIQEKYKISDLKKDINNFDIDTGLSQNICYKTDLFDNMIYELEEYLNKNYSNYMKKFKLSWNEKETGNIWLRSFSKDCNEIINRNKEDINESEEINMNTEMYDFIIECYDSVLFDDSNEDELTLEGANLDARKLFKESKKNYKAIMKLIKRNIKTHNYDLAKKECNNLIDELEKNKKEFLDIEGGFGSFVFSLFTAWTADFARNLLLCIIPIVGPAIAGIKELIQVWSKPIKKIAKGEDISLDDFNAYKNIVESRVKELIGKVKSIIKDIEKAEKEEAKLNKEIAKKQGKIDRNAKLTAAKTALYESCKNGEITVEEREEMLNDLINENFLEEAELEDIQEEVDLDNYEKFNKVRSALYERCSIGEITIEQRENLIDMAKEKIFNESSSADESKKKEMSKVDKDALVTGVLATLGMTAITGTALYFAYKPTRELKKAIKIYESQWDDLVKMSDMTVEPYTKSIDGSLSSSKEKHYATNFIVFKDNRGKVLFVVDRNNYSTYSVHGTNIRIYFKDNNDPHNPYYTACVAKRYGCADQTAVNAWAKKIIKEYEESKEK